MNSKYLVTLQFNHRVSHTFSHTIHSGMVSSTSYNNPSSFGGFKYGNVYLELPMSVELTGYRLIAPGYTPAIPDEWTLYGSSNNGVTWTEIHNKSDPIIAVPGLMVQVENMNIAIYNAFKWNFRKTTDLSNVYIGLKTLALYTRNI